MMSVSMGGSAVCARSVEGQVSVSTGGGAESARNVTGRASVCDYFSSHAAVHMYVPVKWMLVSMVRIILVIVSLVNTHTMDKLIFNSNYMSYDRLRYIVQKRTIDCCIHISSLLTLCLLVVMLLAPHRLSLDTLFACWCTRMTA